MGNISCLFMLMTSNMFGENLQTIREITGIFIKASKDIGLEVNSEKTKYMITSRQQHIVHNQNIVIESSSFEKVSSNISE